MTTVNIFEQAARKKTRVQTAVGAITTEQLWDLELSGNSKGLDLDTVAQGLHEEIEKLGQKSFVRTTTNPRKADLELQFGLVKHVIDVKLAEAAARKDAALVSKQRQVLTEALAKREEQDLANLSTEDLKKRLAELGA